MVRFVFAYSHRRWFLFQYFNQPSLASAFLTRMAALLADPSDTARQPAARDPLHGRQEAVGMRPCSVAWHGMERFGLTNPCLLSIVYCPSQELVYNAQEGGGRAQDGGRAVGPQLRSGQDRVPGEVSCIA